MPVKIICCLAFPVNSFTKSRIPPCRTCTCSSTNPGHRLSLHGSESTSLDVHIRPTTCSPAGALDTWLIWECLLLVELLQSLGQMNFTSLQSPVNLSTTAHLRHWSPWNRSDTPESNLFYMNETICMKILVRYSIIPCHEFVVAKESKLSFTLIGRSRRNHGVSFPS